MTRSKRDGRGKRLAGEIIDPDTSDPVGSPKGKRWAKLRARRGSRREEAMKTRVEAVLSDLGVPYTRYEGPTDNVDVVLGRLRIAKAKRDLALATWQHETARPYANAALAEVKASLREHIFIVGSIIAGEGNEEAARNWKALAFDCGVPDQALPHPVIIDAESLELGHGLLVVISDALKHMIGLAREMGGTAWGDNPIGYQAAENLIRIFTAIRQPWKRPHVTEVPHTSKRCRDLGGECGCKPGYCFMMDHTRG